MARKKAEEPEVEPETAATRATKAYKSAEDKLKEFMQDPAVVEIMQEFYQLVDERNTALDAAVRAVKSEVQRSEQARLVINGIGAQKRWKRYYDTDFLNEHLPVRQARMILTEHTTYELNQPLLEQLIRQGEVDNEVVRQAFHEEEQNPASMPGTPSPWSLPPIPTGD